MEKINFKHNLKIFFLVIRINFQIFMARKSLWLSLFLFSLVLLTVFPFAFGTEMLKRFEIQIGSYWIIQEFVVSLLVLNMYKFETESGIFDLYNSTRASKFALFFGKIIFTWLQILSVQMPLLLFWIIIFNPDISILLHILPTLITASCVFAFTSSLLGGFLYSITRISQLKEVLQPLLFFPLQSASLLASVGVCLKSQSVQSMLEWSAWWNILLVYPVLFIGLVLLIGDAFLEE